MSVRSHPPGRSEMFCYAANAAPLMSIDHDREGKPLSNFNQASGGYSIRLFDSLGGPIQRDYPARETLESVRPEPFGCAQDRLLEGHSSGKEGLRQAQPEQRGINQRFPSHCSPVMARSVPQTVLEVETYGASA
ncbi:MAG: hypothetical protein ACK4KV_08850 [Rhodocyclaceae bacterium]